MELLILWENPDTPPPPISVPTGVICLFTVPLLYRQHQVGVTGSQSAVSWPNTGGLTTPCFPTPQPVSC